MKHNLLFAFAVMAAMGFTSAMADEITLAKTPGAGFPTPLPNSELSDLSGGASSAAVAVTNQTLSALNSGNSVNANSVVTGDVSIDASAFSGFNGVGNFVFNTGNNNNLQGSLSITILTPPAK
jgi:hypothetical protein